MDVIFVFFIIIALVTCIGNSALCCSYYKHLALRTLQNKFVVSSSLCGYIVAIVFVPAFIWTDSQPMTLQLPICSVVSSFTGFVTLFNIMALTYERYIAIFYGIQYQIYINNKRVNIILIFVWVIPFIIALTPLLFTQATDNMKTIAVFFKVYQCLLSISLFISTISIFCVYVRISLLCREYKIKDRQRKKSVQQNISNINLITEEGNKEIYPHEELSILLHPVSTTNISEDCISQKENVIKRKSSTTCVELSANFMSSSYTSSNKETNNFTPPNNKMDSVASPNGDDSGFSSPDGHGDDKCYNSHNKDTDRSSERCSVLFKLPVTHRQTRVTGVSTINEKGEKHIFSAEYHPDKANPDELVDKGCGNCPTPPKCIKRACTVSFADISVQTEKIRKKACTSLPNIKEVEFKTTMHKLADDVAYVRKSSLQKAREMLSEMNNAKVVATIFILNSICWFPLIFINFVDSVGGRELIHETLIIASQFSFLINTLAIPFVYGFCKKDFRRYLNRLYTQWITNSSLFFYRKN